MKWYFFIFFVCTDLILYAQRIKFVEPKPLQTGLFKRKEFPKFNMLLAENYVTCSYGFFCKQELKLEKLTNMPVRFRVGSLAYCDWLEGKRRYVPTLRD